MSIYKGELTTNFINSTCTKLKLSFPTLPSQFFIVFADRLKDNGFNDARLKDAVNNVIDNCIYPTPTIAQFISFDQHIKLYTYAQMMKLVNEDVNAMTYHKSVRLREKQEAPMYAHINDVEKYRLELWNKQK